MRKLLKKIYVIQEVSSKSKDRYLVGNNIKFVRINPYNPLSYIFLTMLFLFGIIAFGVYGFWKEADLSNPFKWKRN